MSDVELLLEEASSQGVFLNLDGDALHFRCTYGHLTDDLKVRLVSAKTEIIEALSRSPMVAPAVTGGPIFRHTAAPDRFLPARSQLSRWDHIRSGIWPLTTINGTHFVERIKASLSFDDFNDAVSRVIARHSALCYYVEERDGVVEYVKGDFDGKYTAFDDFSELADPENENLARQCISATIQRPFNSTGASPWFRFHLIKLSGNDYVVGVVAHHFICDGVSLGIIRSDLYNALGIHEKAPNLHNNSSALQYADVARGINNWVDSIGAHDHLAYWKAYLKGAGTSKLPTDYPSPPKEKSLLQCIRSSINIQELVNPESKHILEQSVSVQSFIVSSLSVVLAHMLNVEDIVIVTLASGRLYPETLPMVGMFFDAVPIRVATSLNAGFDSMLKEVTNDYLGSHEHQVYSYYLVAEHFAEIMATGVWPWLNFIDISKNKASSNEAGVTIVPFRIGPWPEEMLPTDIREYFVVQATYDGVAIDLEIQFHDTMYKENTIRLFLDMVALVIRCAFTSPCQKLSQIFELLAVSKKVSA